MASFLTIWLTRKCLPTSRRKSSADIGAVQSRLLTRSAALSPSKSRKGRDLPLDPRHPLGRLLLGLQHPLGVGPGVTDEPGRPTDEADDPVARPLEVPQHDELDEVAEVQRRCRRVEAAIRVTGPFASASRSAASSVVCATRPRHCSSSKMSVTGMRSSGLRLSPAGGVPTASQTALPGARRANVKGARPRSRPPCRMPLGSPGARNTVAGSRTWKQWVRERQRDRQDHVSSTS